MKKLYILILLLFIFGCSSEQGSENITNIVSTDTATIIPETDTDEEDTDEDDTSTTTTTTTTTLIDIVNKIEFLVQTDTTTYFYNGTDLSEWKTGTTQKVGPNEFVVDDTIYTLDSGGSTTSTTPLNKTPTAINRTEDGVVWCFQYTSQEALAMGGLPKPFCLYDSDCGESNPSDEFEIIGNKYENPELLEEQ